MKIYFTAPYKIKNEGDIEVVNTPLLSFLKSIKNEKIIGLDIETSKNHELSQYENKIYKGGLDPYLSNIVMVQIGTKDKTLVIDYRYLSDSDKSLLKRFLHFRDDVLFVGHNLKFEQLHLNHKLGVELKEVWDTMIAELVLYNGYTLKLGLVDLADKYLGIKKKENLNLFSESGSVSLDERNLENENIQTPFELEYITEIDKSTRMQFINIGMKHFTYSQVAYGSDDIVLPLFIQEIQEKGHNIVGELFQPLRNIRLQSKFVLCAAEMELTGLPYDEKDWAILLEENRIKNKKYKEALDATLIRKFPEFNQLSLFGGNECVINWDSPKQVIDIFKRLKCCPKEKSKSTGEVTWSVGKEAVLKVFDSDYEGRFFEDRFPEKIESNDDFLLAYLLYRKTIKNINDYGELFKKYVHPITGRVHFNVRPYLLSGRNATTKPNVQAVPGGHRKALHHSDEDNKVFNVHDYSSQESRVIASLSDDPLLITFFNNGDEKFGDDFHSWTAQNIENKKGTGFVMYPSGHENFTKSMKKKRTETKTVSFGLPYGIQGATLASKLKLSEVKGNELLKDYFETYEGVKGWLNNQHSFVARNNYFIYGNEVKSIYIDSNLELLRKANKISEKVFLTDKYRDMIKSERETYKQAFYLKHPQAKDIMKTAGKARSRMQNRSGNLPIQGTSALQSKAACVQIREWKIKNEKHDYKLILLLHDEIVSECDKQNGEEYGKIQERFMVSSAEYFCPNVKFTVSGGSSDRWEH